MKKTAVTIAEAHRSIRRAIDFKEPVEITHPAPDPDTKKIRSYHDSPLIKRDDNGKVTEIHLNSSVITKMYHRFDVLEYCPKKIAEMYVYKVAPDYQTAAMNNGRYFETHVLGSGVGGDQLWELPLRKDGKIPIAVQRINEQIDAFPLVCEKYGIIVQKEDTATSKRNTQIVDRKQWDKVDDVKIIVNMTYDLVSPITYANTHHESAIIDVKLPGDRNVERGPYPWGLPHVMDHTQAFIYSFASGLPFFYLVFDYPAKNMGHKVVPVNTFINHENPEKAAEAKMRLKETDEMIRRVAIKLLEYDELDAWYTMPSYYNCRTCTVENCPDRGKNSEV